MSQIDTDQYTGTEQFELIVDWHHENDTFTLQQLQEQHGIILPYIECGKGVLRKLKNGHRVLVVRKK